MAYHRSNTNFLSQIIYPYQFVRVVNIQWVTNNIDHLIQLFCGQKGRFHSSADSRTHNVSSSYSNTGDIPDDIVSRNIDEFQNNPNELVFIGTWDKVSTGITLNAAAYMICIDTPYTYAMFSQGTDRIWRVNNTRPAFITVLVGAETIDERVMQIIETKKDLSDFLVDGADNIVAQETLNSELYAILKELF